MGRVTVSPRLALNWLTAELADYEYGVPADRACEGRPACHNIGRTLEHGADQEKGFALWRQW